MLLLSKEDFPKASYYILAYILLARAQSISLTQLQGNCTFRRVAMCLVIKIRVVLLRRRMTIGNKIAISYIRRKLTCYFSSKRETKHNNEVQNECERNYQDCSQPELSESQRRKFLKSSGKLLLQGVTNTSSSSNICNSI